jgi:hypothetical protein
LKLNYYVETQTRLRTEDDASSTPIRISHLSSSLCASSFLCLQKKTMTKLATVDKDSVSSPSFPTGDRPSWITDTEVPTPSSGNSEFFERRDLQSPAADKKNSTSETSSCRYFFRRGFFLVFSFSFVCLFTVSAVIQINDEDSLGWLLFYAFHATLAALCVIQNLLCFPQKLVLGLAAAMMNWSIVLVIIFALRLHNTEHGGPDEGGDDPNRNAREEIEVEVAGAALGLISALYHAVWMNRCSSSSKSSGSTD